MTQVGRHGEAVGGRFVEFKLTKIGFGGMTAPEKVHRLFRVATRPSSLRIHHRKAVSEIPTPESSRKAVVSSGSETIQDQCV